MKDLIKRLRDLHPYFNPPINPTQLEAISQDLRFLPFPYPKDLPPVDPVFDELLTLYRDHNGMPIHDAKVIPIRLMSCEEAFSQNTVMFNLNWSRKEHYLLWTDDNGNFMGIYLDAPLKGRIFIVDHEEIIEDMHYPPCFRSVRSFYKALLTTIQHNMTHPRSESLDWFSFQTDYPKQQPDEFDEADRKAAHFYLDKYRQEENDLTRRDYAFIAMNLLPTDELEPLMMFADDNRDMWIQAHAIDIFALRQNNEAVPVIERIVRKRAHNPYISGINALGKIGTSEAKEALLRIADEVGHGHRALVRGVLEKLGIETRRKDGVLSYRLSPDDEWVDFVQND